MYSDSQVHRHMEIGIQPTSKFLRNTSMPPVPCIPASLVGRGDESQHHVTQVHGPGNMTADILMRLQHLRHLQSPISNWWSNISHPAQTTRFEVSYRRERSLDAELHPPRDLAYQPPQRRFSMWWRQSLGRTVSYETWPGPLSKGLIYSCHTS